MIRPSKATVIVPAAVPNNNTDANTKVSETEIVAATDGSLTGIEPLINVRTTRTSHCGATVPEYNTYADFAITANPEITIKAMKN